MSTQADPSIPILPTLALAALLAAGGLVATSGIVVAQTPTASVTGPTRTVEMGDRVRLDASRSRSGGASLSPRVATASASSWSTTSARVPVRWR